MLAVAVAAITINDTFEGHHRGFAISFAAILVLITYLWWSVGLYDPSHKVFNKYYTFNYGIAFILLIVSIFINHWPAAILWIIVLNLTPGLTGARTIVKVLKQRGQAFSAAAALVEHFDVLRANFHDIIYDSVYRSHHERTGRRSFVYPACI